ncbi:MAG: M3 family metallopeptidase [Methylobacteriaceae bacterium]|nr:M3 family metallopeptidase [Methylobacteriaceae bacterium]
MSFAENPLLETWATPFGLPPFDRIAPEHFRDAYDVAITEHRAEIEAVATSAEPPSFANTVAALERSGRRLSRVSGVFYNLTGAHTSDALRAVEREMSPILARHWSSIYLDARLYARLDRLEVERESLGLSAEEARVLWRHHKAFRRTGAGLPDAARARLAEIAERLAVLSTRFGQNVLADEQSFVLPLAGEEDLAGLPDWLRAAAADAARERGLDGHVVTLSRSLIEPFLTLSPRRDLRERAYLAWIGRGETGGQTDNRALAAEMVALRAEQAAILGYPSYAHFKLDDAMAKNPDNVHELLRGVWEPARALAERERADLDAMLGRDAGAARLAGHDWRFYAERVRRDRFAIDEAEVKAYLPLEGVIAAAFDTASRLFGLSFAERPGLPVYHPDVRAFEVTDRDGRHVGLFLGDYYARPSKRSGAWMSAVRGQRKLDEDVRPIIVNVMNFARGAGEAPTLLSFDDARTLFHEFGHALHGLLSDVTYPSLAGTAVARDFVEFPSQLFEHWLEEPQVLRRFARHHATGEPMPEGLLAKVLAARRFNQGFATVEYCASAAVDLELHLQPSADNLDVVAFEKATLAELAMPEAIAMRHRTPHFTHVFSGGYASAYYSYLWSEILDADGFDAFREAGDPFDPDLARRLRDNVYAAGDLRDPAEAYLAFRGRPPRPEALLRQRGLAA